MNLIQKHITKDKKQNRTLLLLQARYNILSKWFETYQFYQVPFNVKKNYSNYNLRKISKKNP